jgi:hypothetical protein
VLKALALHTVAGILLLVAHDSTSFYSFFLILHGGKPHEVLQKSSCSPKVSSCSICPHLRSPWSPTADRADALCWSQPQRPVLAAVKGKEH